MRLPTASQKLDTLNTVSAKLSLARLQQDAELPERSGEGDGEREREYSKSVPQKPLRKVPFFFGGCIHVYTL